MKVAGLSKREVQKRVNRAAEILQIEPLLKRKPAALSGGQRQRVAIGRALVRDVNVFLFDEPLSNLDAKLRTDLRIELKRLHQRLGNTMIYVTHDQIEALTLADRIAVMKDGLIQQLDTPHEIYNNPTNRFVAGFIGSPGMNFLSGSLVNSRDSGGRDNGVDNSDNSDDKKVKWLFVTPDLKIPLNDYAFKQTPVAGQPVEIGIRPENIALGTAVDSAAVKITVKAEIVEPMGADTVIWTSIAGNNMTIRTHSGSVVKPGDQLNIGINLARFSLFAHNGDRI